MEYGRQNGCGKEEEAGSADGTKKNKEFSDQKFLKKIKNT